MRSTVWRTLLLTSIFLTFGPLAEDVLAGQLTIARPPQRLVARKPLRLEVRITAAHWQGDIHIPERWGTELRTESRSSMHFRFARPNTAPKAVSYRVYLGSPPSDPATQVRPIASGSLGAPPAQGGTREFDVDFTKFLPPQPNGRDYHVRLVGPGVGGEDISVWSNTVKISYSGDQPVTQFTSPTLTRVAGTTNALGEELKLLASPMAVITRNFRVEGTDINEVPAETVVQILKDGKVVSELHPQQKLTQRLPSGVTSLAVRMPEALAGPLYDVRVKSPWGTTGQQRMSVGGNRPPNVGAWQLLNGGVYENYDWTEECQGMATDGSYWYISSNNDGERALYKFTIGMKRVARHDMEQYGSEHVGALDCFDGNLYVALEQPKKLLVISTEFTNAKTYKLHGTQIGNADPLGGTFAWCAVHPITGDICTSKFDYAESLYSYRKADDKNYVYFGTVSLGKGISRVQGGDISPAGKLLLVSDKEPFGIYVYNVFTGQYYGAVTFGINPGSPDYEELEGLTISPPGTAVVGGSPVNVHLVLLDNDPDPDDVYFKHVRVPSLEDLFSF